MLHIHARTFGAVVCALALAACIQGAIEHDENVESVEQATTVAELEAYVLGRLCSGASDVSCLEPRVMYACSSSSAGFCPRRGYNWRGETPGRIDPHMTLTYLRLLRNLAASSPDAVPQPSVSWGLTAEEMLWHQVQMMLRTPQTKFYATSAGTSGGTVPPLTPGQVASGTGHTIDPTKFYSVAWVNSGGTAHAMAQADMGRWFMTVAYNFAADGDTDGARYYLQLSERVFRTYALRDEDGGVRNNKRSYKCFNGLYCYWFHSFVVGESADPSTVLNQNLHAIRDAMEAHNQLRAWPWPLPTGLDPDHLGHLAELSRGALFQLAYGPGNGTVSTAPPNLAEFEVLESDTTCGSYGYASYGYDMVAGTRTCIKPMTTCHYHFHSMSLLKRVIELIDIDPDFASDPYFVGVKFKLLYGRDAGDTRTCNGPDTSPAATDVSSVPLARLYHSSALTPFRLYCDGDPSNDNEVHYDGDGNPVEAYSDATNWADGDSVRSWYDAVYAGCTF